MTKASVVGKTDSVEHEVGSAGVVDSGHGYKCAGIVEVGHNTYLQLVFVLGLTDIEAQLQSVEVHVDARHSVDATLVEDEAVVATVGITTAVINHGFIFVCHRDILVCESPAGEHVPCFRSSGSCV